MKGQCFGWKVIKTIVDGAQKPGFYNIKWDAKDNSGKKVSPGVYFYELDAGDFKSTKKLILLQTKHRRGLLLSESLSLAPHLAGKLILGDSAAK